ncbi:non-homologous end-joining DNA ligase [Symbioplanes lichenis]|uniref:non-homologous end-joining DNA ligase n=1 Tax=Symbioplanes lichenis TaxID=1629072 RepID=UPI00273993F1|nr:non-homologous end-joining DNA ligase [Actinoplanes lichenis]
MRVTGKVEVPELIPPMLAAGGPVPAGASWAYEFKYDGVRAISYVDGAGLRVLSRNNNTVTGTYPELAELGALLGDRSAVLDGEIVALEPGDRPSFARLQQRMHVALPSPALLATVPVVYYVFDVLHLDGSPVRESPWSVRRSVLEELGLRGTAVRTSHLLGGDNVLEVAALAGMEGVVAKRRDAPYRPGKRSADWTKTPLIRTQEVLVVGWKAGAGRRAGTLGSLLLGVFDDSDRLSFAGHVGTGFTDAGLRALSRRLEPLARTTPPLPDVPREHARHAHWVEPVLIGEVAFRTWTPEGRLRHPVWRGLRTDRPARPVIPPPSQGTIEGALQTPDGRWRVEAVRRGRDRFYRLIHGDNTIDGLVIATVERLLHQAGIDMADLIEPSAVTPPEPYAPSA